MDDSTEMTGTMAAVRVATRRAGGVTQLGELVGVTRQTVHRWLNGSVQISAEQAKAVANAVGLLPADFRPDLWDATETT